jgi:S-layer protein
VDISGSLKGDAGTTSTDGNNTFNATTTATFNALDNLDGGAGTDTLNVVDNVAAVATAGRVVKNIETANLVSASTVTADTTAWTLLTTLVATGTGGVNVTAATTTTAITASNTGAQTMTIVGGGGAVSATTGAAAILIGNAANGAANINAITSATTSGGSTVGITDNSGALGVQGTKLTTVSITSAADDQTLTGNGITTVNLTKLAGNTTVGDTTVTAAAGTRVLTVNYNGVDIATTAGSEANGTGVLTLTDAEATTLNINAVTAASFDAGVSAAKATSVAIKADVAIQLQHVTAGVATAVAISGAAKTTITTDTFAAAAVITSTSTGGVTLIQALLAGQQYVGTASSGVDTLTLVASTKAITTGAGDDIVTLNAVAALGALGSVDAGEGTADTLVFNTYANAVTASGATTFAPTVSGFERLEFSGVNAAAAAAINLANLDAINHVTLSAVNTETTTISNMGANGTIVFKASQTTAKPVTVTLADSSGGSDVLNVVLSKATATALVGLTAANVETVNVTSTETATTLLGTVTHGVEALVIADAKALTISGNAGVTITTLTGTAMTSIDASGVTAGLVSFTTGALAAAATIKGGAAANTVVASAATKAVTYTGQDKVDTITINNALNNVVNTGGDADIIVTGTGADTINGGLGNDTITSGTGLDLLTGGGGNDTYNLTLNASGVIYASIKDANAGDIISVTDKGTEVSINGGTTMGAAIVLAGAATFSDYLNAATITSATPGTNGVWAWFQFGGNTYVVADQTNATVFTAATDFLVELTGLVSLTNSTGVGTNAITIV